MSPLTPHHEETIRYERYESLKSSRVEKWWVLVVKMTYYVHWLSSLQNENPPIAIHQGDKPFCPVQPKINS